MLGCAGDWEGGHAGLCWGLGQGDAGLGWCSAGLGQDRDQHGAMPGWGLGRSNGRLEKNRTKKGLQPPPHCRGAPRGTCAQAGRLLTPRMALV